MCTTKLHSEGKVLGPKDWNKFPYKIKSSENLISLNTMIKDWNRAFCTWKIYQRAFKTLLGVPKGSI